MKIDALYLIHHSHTDISYTNDQPIVWELNTRFIDEALVSQKNMLTAPVMGRSSG